VDRAGLRARFLLEAEITGNLEHPGIVPVYSLGRNASGRPFYAMRFILTVTDFGGDAVFAGFHEAPRFRCRSRNSLWPSKLSAPIFRQPTSVQQSLLPFPRP